MFHASRSARMLGASSALLGAVPMMPLGAVVTGQAAPPAWRARILVLAQERSGNRLSRYAVRVPLDGPGLVARGQLRRDGANLRVLRERDRAPVPHFLDRGATASGYPGVIQGVYFRCDLPARGGETYGIYFDNPSGGGNPESPAEVFTYFEDFERPGEPAGWRPYGPAGARWIAAAGSYGQAAGVTPQPDWVTVGSLAGRSSWTRYAFETRVVPNPVGSITGFMVGAGSAESGELPGTAIQWLVASSPNGALGYSRIRPLPSTAELDRTPGNTLVGGRSNRVRMEMLPGRVRCYLGDSLEKEITWHPDPEMKGGIGVALYSSLPRFEWVAVRPLVDLEPLLRVSPLHGASPAPAADWFRRPAWSLPVEVRNEGEELRGYPARVKIPLDRLISRSLARVDGWDVRVIDEATMTEVPRLIEDLAEETATLLFLLDLRRGQSARYLLVSGAPGIGPSPDARSRFFLYEQDFSESGPVAGWHGVNSVDGCAWLAVDGGYGLDPACKVDGRYLHVGSMLWPRAWNRFRYSLDVFPTYAQPAILYLGVRGEATKVEPASFFSLLLGATEDGRRGYNTFRQGQVVSLDETPAPTLVIGRWNQVSVEVIGSRLTLWINGQLAKRLDAKQDLTGGIGVGIYTSRVLFDNISVEPAVPTPPVVTPGQEVTR